MQDLRHSVTRPESWPRLDEPNDIDSIRSQPITDDARQSEREDDLHEPGSVKKRHDKCRVPGSPCSLVQAPIVKSRITSFYSRLFSVTLKFLLQKIIEMIS